MHRVVQQKCLWKVSVWLLNLKWQVLYVCRVGLCCDLRGYDIALKSCGTHLKICRDLFSSSLLKYFQQKNPQHACLVFAALWPHGAPCKINKVPPCFHIVSNVDNFLLPAGRSKGWKPLGGWAGILIRYKRWENWRNQSKYKALQCSKEKTWIWRKELCMKKWSLW